MAKKVKTRPRAPTIIDKQAGVRMREARIARGISQDVLAQKLGISFQQVQKYEKGSNRITLNRAILICKTLEIDLNYLGGWDSTVKVDFTPHTDIFVLSNEFSKLDDRLRSALLTFSRSMIRHGFTAQE